jgi:hypothetical protein
VKIIVNLIIIFIYRLLLTYEDYLSSLNPDYIYNIAAAEKKFKELFSSSPTYIKNSAFSPFWNFYLTAADYYGCWAYWQQQI